VVIYILPHNTVQDVAKVKKTTEIAETFRWPFGNKAVIARENNQGMVKQWYYSWIPASETEAAFILEDDLEVSPLFFRWSYRAVQKYYTQAQRLIHRQLLLAVKDQIRKSPVSSRSDSGSGSKSTSDKETTTTTTMTTEFGTDVSSVIDRFTREFAGKPVLDGVCLQKQHLDPARYPKRLSVRNGNRPFLYR
jgi:hypothetical protein